MATPPSIKISEEGLAKLREELSSEEMRIGLARIQELIVSMKATEHNKEAAKKMLGLTDEELEKIDDDIDMDHGALYLKIELTLKDQFKMTDTKNLNRVIRLVSDQCVLSLAYYIQIMVWGCVLKLYPTVLKVSNVYRQFYFCVCSWPNFNLEG